MEEENPLEAKEKLDELSEHRSGWTRYLAITTAFIAVVAALAAMKSGNLANEALIEKNDAILAQSKASDQWSYYQAKGIKKNIADGFAKQFRDPAQKGESARYGKDQKDIQDKAKELEREVARANRDSAIHLENHHKAATAVTFFQVAIALSAMAALMRQKWFWFLSIGLATAGAIFLLLSFSAG